MARAVIITSYLEFPLDIPSLLEPEDYIVCLDGGFDIARRMDITPNMVLGDFDSLQEGSLELMQRLAGAGQFELRQYPPEKDYTDLELALRLLKPTRTPDLLIIGGLGGRLDQTLINIQLIQRYSSPRTGSRHFSRIELMDGRSHCYVVHGGGNTGTPQIHRIPSEPDSYLSLIPLTEECGGVTLQGVKYPLDHAVLRRGTSLSISNEFLEDDALLSLRVGGLLVVITRGNANDRLQEE